MREKKPEGAGNAPAKIDQHYYDASGYFTEGGSHLLSPESNFHRYRVREVLAGCGDLTGLRVLDLGCGWGTISFALAAAGAGQVIGIDFSAAAISICRERLGREPSSSLEFLQGDAGDTGLPAGEWDLVVAADLVEHLYPEDTLRVYTEAQRLLRPGGRLLIWTPNPGHILERLRFAGILRADPTHVDYKRLGRLGRDLESTGFRILESRYRPSHLPVFRWIETALQGFIPVLRRRILLLAERL